MPNDLEVENGRRRNHSSFADRSSRPAYETISHIFYGEIQQPASCAAPPPKWIEVAFVSESTIH